MAIVDADMDVAWISAAGGEDALVGVVSLKTWGLGRELSPIPRKSLVL